MAAREEQDVCESWEDIDEARLNLAINNLLATNDSEASESQKSADEGNSSSSNKNFPEKKPNLTTMVVLEDNSSLTFIKEPSIKILKRPSVGPSDRTDSLRNGLKNCKSLEQRQKEYEEKRLRILGEAKCQEDIIDESLSRLQLTKPVMQQPTNSLDIGTTIKVLRIENSVRNENRDCFIILRQPLGPNELTKGFDLKR